MISQSQPCFFSGLTKCLFAPKFLLILYSFAVFFLLLLGSACKKESNNGVPGGPKEDTFSGCRLSQAGIFDVSYNANGSLKTMGDWIYQYNENEVVVFYYGNNPLDGVILWLNDRGFPERLISFNNLDSAYSRYFYNEDDYLIMASHMYEREGMPKREFDLLYSYDESGNRKKISFYWNDTLIEKVSFKYDYTKVDNRKNFFERVYVNPVNPYDFSDFMPVYQYYNNCVGKWNANLVKEISIEYNGNTEVYDLKNYLDAKGNLVKTIYEQNRIQIGIDSYKFTCK